VPFAQLADGGRPRTTVVACSHVNWRTGELAPVALAEVDVPVILDGARGAGAVPVDVAKLGCAAYAAAGQKWLCGADGTGLLYLAPTFRDRVRTLAPSYLSFEDASLGFESSLKPDARRHDTPSLARETIAFSAASLRVLREADLAAVLAAARAGGDAGRAARRPRPHGRAARPHDARVVRGRGPGGHARPPARGRRLVATSRAPRSCAPPWARGRARTTSSACSPRSSGSLSDATSPIPFCSRRKRCG
jgi:L-cysteine/cystine lyase